MKTTSSPTAGVESSPRKEPSGRLADGARHPIRIGVGGWVFPEWRDNFYPKGLAQRLELNHASRRLGSIEINATFHGPQRAESFERWRDETPDGFVFSVKGPKFATNRRVLAEAGDTIERFFASGVTRLGPKLGPLNWQFASTKRFDAADLEAFLQLLPRQRDGATLRHALEVRHPSFDCEAFRAIARAHSVAIVQSWDADYPLIEEQTAGFAYVRMLGTQAEHTAGYSSDQLQEHAKRLQRLAAQGEVFAYVIGGAKARNPAAAMALIERCAG